MHLFSRKAGSGKPLVILHGLFGISDNWNSLAKRWAESFTVYTLDLRNHGQSPHAEEFDYTVMAEDVIEFFGEEKLQEVILLGHSMGGKVGMRLALDFPQALSKLIVSDIAPKKYAEHNRNVVDALLKVQPEKLTSRKEAEAILAQQNLDNGTIQFLLKNLFWKDENDGSKHLAWRFNLDVIDRKLSAVSEATDSPAPCEVETLFIRGDRSHYIKDEDFAEIKRIFPSSEIVTIPNAGHWVHADNPQAMYDTVMRFAK